MLVATTVGVAASLSSALSGVWAPLKSVLYALLLVATIGLHMDITRILEAPKFLFLGVIWMAVHAILMLVVARIIKQYFIWLLVVKLIMVLQLLLSGCSGISSALAPVGVLLAILGYASTYMAYLCGINGGVPV